MEFTNIDDAFPFLFPPSLEEQKRKEEDVSLDPFDPFDPFLFSYNDGFNHADRSVGPEKKDVEVEEDLHVLSTFFASDTNAKMKRKKEEKEKEEDDKEEVACKRMNKRARRESTKSNLVVLTVPEVSLDAFQTLSLPPSLPMSNKNNKNNKNKEEGEPIHHPHPHLDYKQHKYRFHPSEDDVVLFYRHIPLFSLDRVHNEQNVRSYRQAKTKAWLKKKPFRDYSNKARYESRQRVALKRERAKDGSFKKESSTFVAADAMV